ncbi:hypothetical protein E5347_13925 [Clostridium sartagoforme]|uniref:Uncharacterized protein n=1 Tax=Clostridium sartagoforme TaxID=84031 RepID=A0A4S2DFY5_9CLOT|nr:MULTISPECIES: DUF6483 family protein [Clostridium]MBS5938725.1 hypothetical protein [Clostridium sp.]TGY40949.1 hypothetical protein E5347_13925 [Clostridium sartagoforme]
MDIERLINELSRNIGKALVNKKEDNMLLVNLENDGSSELLRIILKSLISKKEYSKAEDLLFDEIEKSKTEAIYKIAVDFYEELSEKSDEELRENNFSKEEVLQGLRDIEALFNTK